MRAIGAVEAGAAARRFGVGAATAVKWVQRWRRTGSVEAKPMGGYFRSSLEAHAETLLGLVAERRDLSVEEIRSALRARIAGLLGENLDSQDFGQPALGDEMLEMVRNQFRKVAQDHMAAAHGWHLNDELIPLAVIEQLAALGVFGLTVSEAFGGAGLGKTAMCVVTEELSRGYIGLGTLGTRSEIAADLSEVPPGFSTNISLRR